MWTRRLPEECSARLVDQRIVRAGGDGVGGPRYEIFHDVLADAVLAWRARHEADSRLEAEREAAEERHRRTRTFAVAAAVAVAILAAISIYALTQRSSARSEARHARAREIAALASLQLPVDPEGSLRLALQANALEPSPSSESVLRTVLRELRVLAVLPGGGPVASVAFSPDGEFALTAGEGGEARLFRVSTGRLVRSFPHGAPLAGASLSPDGSLVVTAGGRRDRADLEREDRRAAPRVEARRAGHERDLLAGRQRACDDQHGRIRADLGRVGPATSCTG